MDITCTGISMDVKLSIYQSCRRFLLPFTPSKVLDQGGFKSLKISGRMIDKNLHNV